MLTAERYTAADEPCVTFKTCNGYGTLPHQPMPFSRIAPIVEVGCDKCGKSLYTYDERN